MTDQSPEERFIDGNYRKIRRLGGGGDGTVYLVQHLATEQLRAAKCLEGKGEHGNDSRVRELNMMKRLHHPALPQIIDVLECDGQTWLVMEYIRGRSLDRLVRGEMTVERFFRIGEQLAEVMRYLHMREIPVLHLDIKPTNVILRPDGQLVLIDFGAAVFLKQGGTDRCLVGTPDFAAPEQYGTGEVDERSDVYAFGMTMYYCLYGRVKEKPDAFQQRGSQSTLQQEKRRERYQRSIWQAGWRQHGWGIGQAGWRRTRWRIGQAVWKSRSRRSWQEIRRNRRKTWWYRRADALLERCLQKKKELRFQNGNELFWAVQKLHRRYIRRKKLQGMLRSSVFLAAVLAFAIRTIQGQPQEERTGEMYAALLKRAKEVGFWQAQKYYKEAALLLPQDKRWYMQLLAQIERDYSFDSDEEQFLQELFYAQALGGRTVLELIKERKEEYGELAYRIGTDYWYFYEGAGARAAAARWFEEATFAWQGKGAQAVAAQVYAQIASYYEKLGKQEEEGKRYDDFCRYWNDLKKLWQMGETQLEKREIRLQIADELLSVLTLHAAQLRSAGEIRAEAEQILRSVHAFLLSESQQLGEEAAGKLGVQYEAACAAVERVFADERGNTIEENKEERGEETSVQ